MTSIECRSTYVFDHHHAQSEVLEDVRRNLSIRTSEGRANPLASAEASQKNCGSKRRVTPGPWGDLSTWGGRMAQRSELQQSFS